MLSGSSVSIINGAQQAIMIVFTLFTSPRYLSGLFTWYAGLASGGFYYAGTKAFRTMWQKVSQKETEFFENSGISFGFQ